jgi:hypothetical protein
MSYETGSKFFPKRNGMLTVAELKRVLDDLPDDMVVVQGGSDHSYNALGILQVGVMEAEYSKKSHYFGEFYGEVSDPKNMERIDVLVIGE